MARVAAHGPIDAICVENKRAKCPDRPKAKCPARAKGRPSAYSKKSHELLLNRKRVQKSRLKKQSEYIVKKEEMIRAILT